MKKPETLVLVATVGGLVAGILFGALCLDFPLERGMAMPLVVGVLVVYMQISLLLKGRFL